MENKTDSTDRSAIEAKIREEQRKERYISEVCGSRFSKATLSGLKIPETEMVKVKKWVDGAKDILVFIGNPGCGKTHFCAALYNYCIGKPGFRFARIWPERLFLARVRTDVDSKIDYIDGMKHYCDDDLMILDDMGSCGLNEWRKEIYQAFLDYRYQNHLPTVITTNLSRKEIEDSFHERFCSRLFSSTNCIIDFGGEDFRKNPDLLR